MKHDCHHNVLMFIQMTKIQDQACDECFCNEWKIAPLKMDNTSFARLGTHLFTNPCLQMKHNVERSRKN